MGDSSGKNSGTNWSSTAGRIGKAGVGAGALLAILSHLGRFADHAEPAEQALTHFESADRALSMGSHVHSETMDEMMKYSELKHPAEPLDNAERSTGDSGHLLLSPGDMVLASRVAMLLSRSQAMHHKLDALSANPRVPVWQCQQLQTQLNNNDAAIQGLKDQSAAQPNNASVQQQIDQAGTEQQRIGQRIDELYNQYG